MSPYDSTDEYLTFRLVQEVRRRPDRDLIYQRGAFYVGSEVYDSHKRWCDANDRAGLHDLFLGRPFHHDPDLAPCEWRIEVEV